MSEPNLVVYTSGTEGADDPPQVFQNYMAAAVAALRILAMNGRVPDEAPGTVLQDALQPDHRGHPKALVGQLTPESQHFVRFADEEMRLRPGQVGHAGQGVTRPADI